MVDRGQLQLPLPTHKLKRRYGMFRTYLSLEEIQALNGVLESGLIPALSVTILSAGRLLAHDARLAAARPVG